MIISRSCASAEPTRIETAKPHRMIILIGEPLFPTMVESCLKLRRPASYNFGNSSIAFYYFIGGVDVGGYPILAGPAVVLRHAQLLFYLVERFAFARHLADPFHQQSIIAFRVLKDFDCARGSVAWNDELRIQTFHHFGCGQNIGDSHEGTKDIVLIDHDGGRREQHPLLRQPNSRVRLAVHTL